jgi:hypothetical protein
MGPMVIKDNQRRAHIDINLGQLLALVSRRYHQQAVNDTGVLRIGMQKNSAPVYLR